MATPTTGQVERSRVDPAKLWLAATAVRNHLGLDQRTICRATGIEPNAMSAFFRNRRLPCAADILALLAWMHLDPSLVMLPPDEAAILPAEAEAPGDLAVAV